MQAVGHWHHRLRPLTVPTAFLPVRELRAGGCMGSRRGRSCPPKPNSEPTGRDPGRFDRPAHPGARLMVFQRHIKRPTRGHRDMHDLTDELGEIVAESGIRRGVATLCNVGSTAALGTIEFEPGLEEDFPAMLDRTDPPEPRLRPRALPGTTATAIPTSRPPSSRVQPRGACLAERVLIATYPPEGRRSALQVGGGPQRRHRRIVPPPSREARIRPSGENATAWTGWSWPTSVTLPAGGRVPQLDGAVRAGGGERGPVGREGHRPDQRRVSHQRVAERRMVHVGDVPDPHRPVPAPRGQGPAVA